MPTLSTSSRATIRSAIEATYGSVSAATGRRKVRFTGETLSYALQFEKSKEIRADRMTSDSILVGAAAQGAINFEASYNEYDTLFESAFQSTFLAFGTAGISPTLTTPTFAANTLTQTGGTSFATIEKGQWVQIRGCTAGFAVNNGIWQSSLTTAATATVLTFEGTPFAQTGAASGTVTISTSRLKNGTALRTHNLEVEFGDIAQFFTFRGMAANKLSLSLASKQIVTGSVDFIGKDAMALAGTSNLVGSDSVNFPTAYPVLNAVSNVAKLYEAGAPLTGTFVKSISIDLDNGLRGQDAIANLGNVGIGNGSITLTGKMSVFFADAILMNKYINNADSSIAIALCDGPIATGNGYVLTLPALEFTNAVVQAQQLDQDQMVDIDFMAKLDPISGRMLLLDRFGAAVV